jgi:peptidoglycan/xylan/chitin deacetylase (PgdA/CDA1 family)
MKFYFTFDCEDFINPLSTQALKYTLELLKKYDLRGIFFLTGQFCETLKDSPEVLDLLENHEIGYHSTSHSVHPGIIEYTDVRNYDEARQIALKRETSKINPLTGEIEDNGGILLLHRVFPKKKIVSFRAPGFSWSPPHLEAIEQLGIRFDFSANLFPVPIHYKKTTFYPLPILAYSKYSPFFPFGNTRLTSMVRLTGKIVARHPLVFFSHPHILTNAEDWDYDYRVGNPKKLRLIRQKSWHEIEKTLGSFDLYLRRVHFLANRGVLEVTTTLEEGFCRTHFSNKEIVQSYMRSTKWFTRDFNYSPKYLLNHFFQYFGT